MWRHRFMADDALRTVAPVLRAVHAATFKVLEDNGVDTDRFTNRSSIMSGLIQEPAAAQGGRVRRVGTRG